MTDPSRPNETATSLSAAEFKSGTPLFNAAQAWLDSQSDTRRSIRDADAEVLAEYAARVAAADHAKWSERLQCGHIRRFQYVTEDEAGVPDGGSACMECRAEQAEASVRHLIGEMMSCGHNSNMLRDVIGGAAKCVQCELREAESQAAADKAEIAHLKDGHDRAERAAAKP